MMIKIATEYVLIIVVAEPHSLCQVNLSTTMLIFSHDFNSLRAIQSRTSNHFQVLCTQFCYTECVCYDHALLVNSPATTSNVIGVMEVFAGVGSATVTALPPLTVAALSN